MNPLGYFMLVVLICYMGLTLAMDINRAKNEILEELRKEKE